MKRRLSAFASGLLWTAAAWGIDAESARLAGRYEALLETNPSQATAFERLWKIYADSGETALLVQRARDRSGDHPVLGAKILLRAGYPADAEALLKKASGAGGLAAAEMYAGILDERGETGAAAQMLEEGGGKDPGTLVRAGGLWQKSGDAVRARNAWQAALALAPDDLALRQKLAAACADSGDAAGAIGHLRVIAAQGSPSERFAAWEEISRRAEEAGQLPEAIAAQESLLGLMGAGHWKLPAARRRLFELERRAGTLDELAAKWRAEAQNGPADPEAARRLAELADFQGNDAERLEWFRRAASLLPKDARLAGETAALELAAGNFREAAALYDNVLARRPGDEDVLFARAEVAVLAGESADAERRIEEFRAKRSGDENAEARAEDFYRRMRLQAPLERMLSGRFAARPGDEAAAAALVRFHLREHRYADAAGCLEKFDDAGLSASDRAAVASRFSQIFQQSGFNDAAAAWARRAVESDPANPDHALALASLLAASDQRAEAGRVLREACAAADQLPREDLDRRLYLHLQAERDAEGLAPDLEKNSAEVRGMVAVLESKAAAGGTESDWLRLARWQRWAGGLDPAASLRKALAMHPRSVALQEAFAMALADSGDIAGSVQALRTLEEWQPGRRVEIQRRIGHLELDRGRADEGLRIFSTLRQESPGDWQAAADLALSEQVVGNWFKAFETWQCAYELAGPDARRTLRQPILNAAVRLQLHGRALEFYEEICASEPDEAACGQVLREAAAFAVEHRLAADWRTRLVRRSEADPASSRWKSGLMILLGAEGRDDEARKALADLARSADETPESLERLLAAADAAGDWNEAARLSRRLAALRRTPDPALAMRHAGYLERAGKYAEASAAWTATATRNARSPEVLAAAAAYFERAGDEDRMEAAMRASAGLGGSGPQVSLRLGTLALERGDRSQALADFREVLRVTQPDTSLYKDCLPRPAEEWSEGNASRAVVYFSRTGGASPPPKQPSPADAQGCRLLAIREIGKLLANSPGKSPWLASFPDGLERIWALWFSGEMTAALAAMEKRLDTEKSGDSEQQAFAALALEAGATGQLGKWASVDPGKSDVRWQNVFAALSRMPGDRLRTGADALNQLLTHAPALRRWQACQILASRNHLRLACALAEGVPDLFPASQAPAAWLELAGWHIELRDPDAAVVRLDRAIAASPVSIAFSDPFFAAIRARWLLTPEGERETFERKIFVPLRDGGHHGAEAAAHALIAALNGRDAEAASQMNAVFANAGGDADWRDLVNGGGARLEEWQLHRLARDLYRADLDRDAALLAMRGENFRRLTEGMFVLNQLAAADREEVPYFLNEWLARGASDEELLQAFLRLHQSGRTETAAIVFDRLCSRDPRNESVCGGILNFLPVPAFRRSASAYFERLVSGDYAPIARAMVQNAGLRQVQLLEQDGEEERAQALLARLRRDDTVNRALLFEHVRGMNRAGRHREALAELESSAAFLASSPGFAIPLAELYSAFGKDREAQAILEREARNAGSPDRLAAADRLSQLAVQSGDPARRAAADSVLAAIPSSWLLNRGQPPADRSEWERLHRELDRPGITPEERFREGAAFLLARGNVHAEMREEEMKRLKKIAARQPALLPEYHVLRKNVAAQCGGLPDFEKTLRSEWASGNGGTFSGEILIQLLLEQRRYDDLAGFLGDYLVDRHFNEQAWDQIARRLLDAGQPGSAARVWSALAERAPGDSRRSLLLAEALWKSGHPGRAEALAAPIARIALLDPQKHLDLAQFRLAVGDPSACVRHLALAPRDVRTAALELAAARAYLAASDFPAARDAIARAMQHPEAVQPEVIARYYAEQNLLGSIEPGANEFHLPRRQLKAFQTDVIGRLLNAGECAQAWTWLTALPGLLREPQGRALLQRLEASDWERAARIWASADGLSWDAQCAAAQFFLRKSQAAASPSARLKDLARAHELHPGSFAIARVYVSELLAQRRDAEARKILQAVISSYADPADRRSAREMLASLQASPALPKEG